MDCLWNTLKSKTTTNITCTDRSWVITVSRSKVIAGLNGKGWTACGIHTEVKTASRITCCRSVSNCTDRSRVKHVSRSKVKAGSKWHMVDCLWNTHKSETATKITCGEGLCCLLWSKWPVGWVCLAAFCAYKDKVTFTIKFKNSFLQIQS